MLAYFMDILTIHLQANHIVDYTDVKNKENNENFKNELHYFNIKSYSLL